MKHFSPPVNSIRPPQPWEPVNMRCTSCGHLFRAKTAGVLEALFKPKCPKCGSTKTERDIRVIH